jgi:hypothetical protein
MDHRPAIRETFFLPENLAQHDFVGVVERMPESLALLNELLSTQICNDGKINTGPPSEAPRYREPELTKLFAEDIAVYESYRAAVAGH